MALQDILHHFTGARVVYVMDLLDLFHDVKIIRNAKRNEKAGKKAEKSFR